MFYSKQILVAVAVVFASGFCALCMAQAAPSEPTGETVLVKPRANNNYHSGSAADAAINRFMNRLTGVAKKQENQERAWTNRVIEIKQVLSEYPLSTTSDGYYTGWHGDYSTCVYAQIDKMGPRHMDWNLRTGDYGLSPDEADTLPPTNIVQECLASVKAKYEQKQADRASEQARQDKLSSCESSSAGQLAHLSAEIVHARNVVSFAQANLDQEKKVEAASGVVDLDTAHQMGELVVYGQQEIDNDFKQYRQLGGKATRTADVVPLNDPCKALRQ
ncbi:hypothetical protein [Fulvimonas soli]|uniref:Uncharacterized protein n=1 Tax=Fulvimonas soli TaxID=155197 RepID=A0A316HP80_9GAMM|nr:hypothetical protein [Fulvimonas soli]PWK82130.1 hypothetical protein C7456_11737 [Fulvimonas soli]